MATSPAASDRRLDSRRAGGERDATMALSAISATRRRAGDALAGDGYARWAAFWVAIALLAAGSGAAITAVPAVALAAVVVPVAALACHRWPYAAVTALFVLSGGFWSIQVFSGLPVAISADLILVGLWLATLPALLRPEVRAARRLWPGAAAALAFAGASLIWIPLAGDVVAAGYTFRVSYWYMLAALLIAYAPLRGDALWILTRLALTTAVAVSGYAVLRWAIGPSVAESALSRRPGVAPFETIGGALRVMGSMGTGHVLASWLAALTPFCAVLAAGVRGRWRLVAYAATALCAVALVGTGVRAALIAAGAGGVLGLVLQLAGAAHRRRDVAAVLLTTLVAVAGAGGLLVVLLDAGGERSDRLTAIAHPTTDVSFALRRQKWNDALHDIRRHPLGAGLGTSGLADQRFGRAVTISTFRIDSTWLKIALEQGLAVMACFVLVLLLLLGGLARGALTRDGPLGATLAAAAAGALLAFCIEMTFDVYLEGTAALGIWLVIGLGMRPLSCREPAGP
jgi:hypothetical protein